MADEQVQTLNTPLPRDFSRVVLTLENVLLDEEKLKVSPSMIDGISKEDEYALRFVGCNLIQTAGLLLKLPQTAMATGQVVFHRFYYSKSLVKHNYEILAMACMYVAAKIEESPRRLRDVLNVFHHMKQVRTKRPIRPLVLDSQYILLKNQVIKAERRLLKELGFCVHVKHPHKLIVSYLQILALSDNRNIIQYACQGGTVLLFLLLLLPAPWTRADKEHERACHLSSARGRKRQPAWFRLFSPDTPGWASARELDPLAAPTFHSPPLP